MRVLSADSGVQHEQDRQRRTGHREEQPQVDGGRRAALLQQVLGLHRGVLAGGHERVVEVLVPGREHRANEPAVALDALVDHLGRLLVAERAGVHEREVRGVEEVVDQLGRAHRGADDGGPDRVEALGVVLGEAGDVGQRLGRGQPHHAVALLHAPRRSGVGPRRDVGGGPDGRDGRAATRRLVAPAVVAALQLAVDDRAGAEGGQAMRAPVDERHQLAAEAGQHPRLTQQHDLCRLVADLVARGHRVPGVAQHRAGVVDHAHVDKVLQDSGRCGFRPREQDEPVAIVRR